MWGKGGVGEGRGKGMKESLYLLLFLFLGGGRGKGFFLSYSLLFFKLSFLVVDGNLCTRCRYRGRDRG